MIIETQLRLYAQLNAICPLVSSNIGVFGESSTVKLDPSQSATKQQVLDAQAFVDSFDWSDEATQAWIDAKEPALKNAKDSSAQMLTEIDTFLATASKAGLDELRAEAVASAQRQRILVEALARLSAKV